MLSRLGAHPAFGFDGACPFMNADGEIVWVVTLASEEGFEAWRTDPEHRAVMQRGLTEWFGSAWTGRIRRRMDWSLQGGRTGYDESHPAPHEPVTIAFSFKLRDGADVAAFRQEQFAS